MDQLLRIEARSAGLGNRQVSLHDVDRRRTELWGLAVAVVSGLALLAALAPDRIPGIGDAGSVLLLRTGLASLAVVFAAYVFEKEAHLRRLTSMLVDERARNVHLTELDVMKSEFLSMVSHELKTPLTSIIGSVSILRRATPLLEPRECEELLAAVDRQARRLSEMVEQLLSAGAEPDVSAGADGVTDIAALARRVAQDFGRSGRPVTVEAPVSCAVGGPPDSLEHVLWNLLDNAYKYGEPPVRLEVDDRDTAVVVSVVDAGEGVAPDQQERVFDRFVRVDADRAHGMGLGLPIVRGIVEACGGRAWIDSPAGGGAAVRFALRAVDSGADVGSSGTLAPDSAVAV